MLKEHSSVIKHCTALADIAVLMVLFAVSHRLVSARVPLEPLLNYWAMFLGFMVFYVYFAWTRSLFSVLQFNMMANVVRKTLVIFGSATVIGAALLYLIPDLHNSRRLYLAFVALSCATIVTEKALLQLFVAWLRRHDRNTTPVLVFGRGHAAADLVRRIRSHPEWGMRVRARLDVNTPVDEFERMLMNSHVEEVLFDVPRSMSVAGLDLDPYLRICEEMGRPARVFLNLPFATRFARWEYHPFMGKASLIAHSGELDPDQVLFKRLFDLACALAGFLLLMLVYPLAALLVRLESRGPVLVAKERMGRNGLRFRLWRFRCECAGGRMTRAGAWLRRLSLEQLPEVVNVLRGEMSIVGVRPAPPDEAAQYKKWHHRRLGCRPGMTGLWRIEDVGRGGLDELIRLDLLYIDSWSIWLDCTVVARTLAAHRVRPMAHVGDRISEAA